MANVKENKEPVQEKKKNVIDALNKARGMELYAISQYMNQHYNLDDDDYGKFAANIKLIAIDEMRHAEQFAERIKELDGEPTTQMGDKPAKGQNVKAVFPFNEKVEEDTINVYNQLMKLCRENGDNVSAKLFEQILVEEQDHYNHFSNEAKHVKNLGDTYLSQIAGTSSSTGGYGKGFSLAKGAASE